MPVYTNTIVCVVKRLLIYLFLGFTTAMQAGGVKIGDLYYNLDIQTATAEVTYQGTGLLNYSELPNSTLTIPATVTYQYRTYSVTAIGYRAFNYCDVIRAVTIPGSVKRIDANAFFNCINLRQITLSSHLTDIGPMAFYRCLNLSSIDIPDSVRVLRGSTFEQCTALKHVTLPDSLNAILDGTFNGCTALSFIRIPDGVRSIGKKAFASCTALSAVSFGDSLRSIGSDAFLSCTALQSAILPDSLNSISAQAFKDCSGLKKIVLPSGLTSLSSNTFVGNKALAEIYCYADTPAVMNSNFTDVDTMTCILYVPENSIALYKDANGWRRFQDIRPLPADKPEQPADAVYTHSDALIAPAKRFVNGCLTIILPDGSHYAIDGCRLR